MNHTALIQELQFDEGFVSHVYPDSLGYQTIGHGRMVDRRRGGGITEAEALFLLENDIKIVVADLDRNIPWWRDLPECPQRALVNMGFMGWPTLSTFKKMIAALKAQDFPEAAAQALDSRWAEQVGDRAKRIAALYVLGETAPV